MVYPRIFALVIGIDDYPSWRIAKLQSAVADANDVALWLQNSLEVEPSRIINLRNHQATRRTIIEELQKLRKNDYISRGDPIFIYYAGHGGEATTPDGWEAGDSIIQTIIPWDTQVDPDEREIILPIPDRTLGVLLSELAEKKGNNITVVFDCCHSASGARELPRLQARTALNIIDLPTDVDKEIYESRAQTPVASQKFVDGDQTAFVMLAACGAKEQAREENGHGLFTGRFLEALKGGAENVTYAELMETLPPIAGQTPQCEGFYKDRFFFNVIADGRNPAYISIVYNGTYRLKAGEAQGITVDSEFTIHDDPTTTSKESLPICTMRVIELECTHAILEPVDAPPVLFPFPAYALQVTFGKHQALHVHFTPALLNAWDSGVVKDPTIGQFDARLGFVLTELRKADVVIDLEDTVTEKKAVFRNVLINECGIKLFRHPVPPTDENILPVLRSMAHWNWHLKRPKEIGNDDVEIKFRRLHKSAGQWKPIMGRSLNHNGLVTLDHNPQDYFGVEIVNHLSCNLYVYVFLFSSNQCIKPLYKGSTGRSRVDPSLRAQHSFTIGYGASGVAPLQFILSDKEQLDVTFLKVFVTNSPADFGALGRVHEPLPSTTRELVVTPYSSVPKVEWGSLMTTIVVNRGSCQKPPSLRDQREWSRMVTRFEDILRSKVDEIRSVLKY